MVFNEILSKAPLPPAQVNPDVAPDLERLVLKALEKDRETRYQTAAEIWSDLKRLKRDLESTQSHARAGAGQEPGGQSDAAQAALAPRDPNAPDPPRMSRWWRP